ncbi:MAG: hypothetical protein IPJ17_18080 [Holophagales bacterium]|nr:MAG: hypothetical protein IPJ17_18080 [Holophagales bacterium]
MFELPSVPSWDALHPFVSHFPIALLLLSPALLLAALVVPARRLTLLALAVWLMAAGTLAVYLSAATGDAARDVAPKAPEIVQAVADHEELGSAVRAVFTGLTVLLVALRFGPGWLKRPLGAGALASATAALLLVDLVAVLLVLKTGHSGALLVHRLGVHARLT